MSFQNFKMDSCGVGGKHRSGIENIVGDVTSGGNKVIIVHCSHCTRTKITTVLGNFFKNLVRKDVMYQKRRHKMF